MSKSILMLAGPNGSGKTTNAQSLLPNHIKIYEFLNADEIAKGLAPLHPETMKLTASKLMIKRLQELITQNKSFVFETTGAGINYKKYLELANKKKYQINLIYLWLASEELAVQRVAQRVSQGGHNIPEADIRRRYKQGIKYILKHYLPLATNVYIIDNSDLNQQKIVAKKIANEDLEIHDIKVWEDIHRVIHG